jgi:hypothetical protein
MDEPKLRHYCLNPHCRSKLPAPVESTHRAFCTRTCYESFYRKRCVVCEREAPEDKPKKRPQDKLCGRRICRNEYRRTPDAFAHPWGEKADTSSTVIQPTGNADKTASKTALDLPRSLRHWRWQRMPGEDEDYELLDAKGKLVACIRQEGDRWWVARPKCTPQPPLETLDEARNRAIGLALMSPPPHGPDPNKRIIKEVLQERELYPWRFSDAGKRYSRGELLGTTRQWESTGSGADVPHIPEILRRDAVRKVDERVS